MTSRLGCLTRRLTLGVPETRMDRAMPGMPRVSRGRGRRAHTRACVHTPPRVGAGLGMLGMLGAPLIARVFLCLTLGKKARQGVGKKRGVG